MSRDWRRQQGDGSSEEYAGIGRKKPFEGLASLSLEPKKRAPKKAVVGPLSTDVALAAGTGIAAMQHSSPSHATNPTADSIEAFGAGAAATDTGADAADAADVGAAAATGMEMGVEDCSIEDMEGEMARIERDLEDELHGSGASRLEAQASAADVEADVSYADGVVDGSGGGKNVIIDQPDAMGSLKSAGRDAVRGLMPELHPHHFLTLKTLLSQLKMLVRSHGF